jgi:hypothetical protein
MRGVASAAAKAAEEELAKQATHAPRNVRLSNYIYIGNFVGWCPRKEEEEGEGRGALWRRLGRGWRKRRRRRRRRRRRSGRGKGTEQNFHHIHCPNTLAPH